MSTPYRIDEHHHLVSRGYLEEVRSLLLPVTLDWTPAARPTARRRLPAETVPASAPPMNSEVASYAGTIALIKSSTLPLPQPRAYAGAIAVEIGCGLLIAVAAGGQHV
jgi:hypothetical protein